MYDVARGIPRGQHQNRGAIRLARSWRAISKPVMPGSMTSRIRRSKAAGLGERQAIAAVSRDGDGVAVFHQALAEQFRHPALILYYQDPHSEANIIW